MDNNEFIKKQNEIIGDLTCRLSFLQESETRRNQWIQNAKREAGYDQSVSFDDVWKDALSALLKSRDGVIKS